jgi:NADPH2:quinone reductase
VPEPVPAAGQVLIEVHAAGVVYPDVLMSQGRYQSKPELPFVPGGQVAGIVASAPPGADVRVGDRVAAVPILGGFAEFAVADPNTVFPLPDRIPFAIGAVIPVNYLTVNFAYLRRARLKAGETVLVHGAAGGLGTVAVQYARALGARVIAVVSTPAKGEAARQAGAHDVVAAQGFREVVAELTGGRGVDVIFDPVGGDRFTDSLRCLSTDGRLLVVGFVGGEIPTVRVNRLLLNNIEVVGVGWGAYWHSRPEYLQEQWAELFPLLESGSLAPIVGATFALADAAAAVGSLAGRTAIGNVALIVR